MGWTTKQLVEWNVAVELLIVRMCLSNPHYTSTVLALKSLTWTYHIVIVFWTIGYSTNITNVWMNEWISQIKYACHSVVFGFFFCFTLHFNILIVKWMNEQLCAFFSFSLFIFVCLKKNNFPYRYGYITNQTCMRVFVLWITQNHFSSTS